MKKPIPSPECFRGFLGDVTKELLSPESEADMAAIMLTAITLASHAAGSTVSVVNGRIRHPVNIWGLVIGDSAIGKKGESFSIVHELFENVMPEDYGEESPFFEDGYPISGASLVNTIALAEASAMEEGLWTETEGFPILFKDEEWAVVLSAMTRDKRLAGQTRKAWDGKQLQHKTTKNGKIHSIVIRRPKIIVLGHGTPDEFRKTLSSADLAGGSVNRFIFCASEGTKQLPFGGELDEKKLAKAVTQLRKYILRAKQHGAVTMTPEATKYWVQCYAECEELIRQEGMHLWVGRAKPYALRLSALFALYSTPLFDDEGQRIRTVKITVEDLKAAMAWIRYSGESAKYTMGAAAAVPNKVSPLALKIWDIVSVKDRTGKELQAELGSRVTKPMRNAAIMELGGKVQAYANPATSGGRKGFIFCVASRVPEGAEVIDLRGPNQETDEPTVVNGTVVKDETPVPEATGETVRTPRGPKRDLVVITGSVIQDEPPVSPPRPRKPKKRPAPPAAPAREEEDSTLDDLADLFG